MNVPAALPVRREAMRIAGKPIVNSLSMKEGEAAFRERAKLVHRYGAAAVIMAFDEEGQATDVERRLAIADRCLMLDKAAQGVIAMGDPKVLRETSTQPVVRAFFRREAMDTAA